MAKLQPDYIKWVLTLNASQAQEEYHKLQKENKGLQKDADATRKRMAELAGQSKANTQEYKNLETRLKSLTNDMSLNRKKMQEVSKQFDLSTMTVAQLKKHLKELQREFNNTSKATDPKRYKELQRQIEETRKAMKDAANSATGLRGAFAKLEKSKEMLVGFFFGIGDGILQLISGSFRDAFNLVVDFERENSKLAGILGVTKEELKDMEAAARQLGSTTSYSAAEVTSLQIELAKLGFAKQEILDMEGGVLKFAKAVGTDLASASAFAGAALRMFGKDASEADDVLATFAVATTKTALDFSKLEASLATVGPVANAFGFSIEDTTALLGKLADAGFDASSAATATRNIILGLADANGDLAKALGSPVKNAEDLAAGLKKLNDEGIDLNKALELTDKRSVAAFSTFLSTADSIGTLKGEISDVTAQFNAMSETMGDNVAGAMAGLKSASEELVLKIASGTNGPIKDLINALTKIVQWTGTAIQWISRFSTYIKGAVIAVGSYVAGLKLAIVMEKSWAAVKSGCISTIAKFNNILKASIALFKTHEAGTIAARRAIVSFKQSFNSIPWFAIITAVASLVTYFISLRKETDKTTESVNHYNEASKESARLYGEQKGKIDSLIRIAQNEELSLRARKKAVDELNKIIPGYNAQIDQTTRKYTAANNVLEAYLKNLEAEIRFKTYEDKYKQLVAEQMEAVDALDQARIELQETPYKTNLLGMKSYNMEAKKAVRTAEDNLINANKNLSDFTKRMEKAEKKGLIKTPESSSGEADSEDPETPTFPEKIAADADSGIQKIKELKKELKDLRKQEASSLEEYQQIESRKSAIRKELNSLAGKSSGKNKRTPGTYSEDSLDEATAQVDDAHQKRLLAINMQKDNIPENEYIIKKNLEMIQHCGELSEALDELEKKTDSTHTQTLDKIKAEQNKINLEIEKANQAINAAMVKEDAANHKKKMEALKAAGEEELRCYEQKLLEQKITQGEFDVLRLKAEKQSHEAQLKALQEYEDEVKNCTYIGERQRQETLEKLDIEIHQMQSQILTDTGKWSEKLRTLLNDPDTLEGIKSAFDLRRLDIEATYAAAIKACKENGEETEALEKEKNRRLQLLALEWQEQQFQLQEAVGLSWSDEYDRELLKLQTLHAKGLVSEKDYQKKRLEMGVQNAQKYFDYYAGLSASAFTAIQEAEIAQSDAKYEVLIQQAKNNGEDTAALEEEKENKKLEIQKKYADVDFAIKIAQIIADTSVAIMKAFSQLGPIGGAIAAALLSATGVAQVVTAKAQRDQVKNMEPGRTVAGASQTTAIATATRELTGYSEGGYTGDGGRYEVAGIVHKGEYVVPKPIMGNPRVIDAVGMIEAIRCNKLQRPSRSGGDTGSGGFADGGYTSSAPAAPEIAELRDTVRELRGAVRNIRAYIVWRDIEDAERDIDNARRPFTK